ncbi:hypothetical protein L207DRAFT_579810 [Hyaloscypha variabilis F]|uniref:Uncharacterized protein n=1 Tax=Hyaloscypha variabilis (strain UAMH 11265 / GT02V1 / F) TaxID=1149755 RepID=A0A2J6RWP7_HYAVF|nr:hypothetical protein L207DRAFT_579810 [Hyaloscypha variabilis F]
MDFDLPNAKRIRRADLYSRPSSSPSPSPAPEESTLLHSRLAELYGPIPIPTSNPLSSPSPQNPTQEPTQKQEQEQDGEGEGFEFRLFSTPHSSLKTQKILLQQPEDLEVGGGFVRRERDKSFYIAPPLIGEARAQIEEICVSGEEVLSGARGRNWGLEVPWRVSVVSVSGPRSRSQRSEKHKKEEEGDKLGRKKPGKKRRIILRERQRKREATEAAKKLEREKKEEAEREKRTRRNREKKVKRKMKEKGLKGGESSGTAVVGEGGEESL